LEGKSGQEPLERGKLLGGSASKKKGQIESTKRKGRKGWKGFGTKGFGGDRGETTFKRQLAGGRKVQGPK